MMELSPPTLPSNSVARCPQCSHHIPLKKIHAHFHCPECRTLLSSNKRQSRIMSVLVSGVSFLLLCAMIVLADRAYYHAMTSNSYYLVTVLFSSVVAFCIAQLLFLLLFRIKSAS